MKSNSLIPEFIVFSFHKSIEFYTDVLGFEVLYGRPEKKFVMLAMQGSQIMINERNGWWETGELRHPLG